MKGFKKLAFILALSTLAVSATYAAGGDKKNEKKAEKGIVFVESSWASILKKAKAEKKVIFLDAYTTWCGPCKLLQKNVFTRADVAEVFNKNFINVKFDMESGEGPQLANKYPIEGYPTLFFIDPNGSVVKTVLGYQKPEALIKIAKTIPKVPGAI